MARGEHGPVGLADALGPSGGSGGVENHADIIGCAKVDLALEIIGVRLMKAAAQ